MSKQLPMAINTSISFNQCNFVQIQLHNDCLYFNDFLIETNHKLIESKIASFLGLDEMQVQETAVTIKLDEYIYGRGNCIKGLTLEQVQHLFTTTHNPRANKYKPILSELILTQVLPLFNQQPKHDDFKKEINIMPTNQLINIQLQQIDGQTVNAVSARELWKFLESKREFTNWVKPYISTDNAYGFVQNTDFIRFDGSVNPTNGVPIIDYWLTIDMAKEVSMLSKTEKGKQARKYFIDCERKVNNPTIQALPNFADPAEAAIAWANQYKEKSALQIELKTTQAQIEADKSHTKLGKMMTMADGTVKIADYTTMLQNEHGIKIGQNRFFEWLREHGYLCKDEKNKNRPTQKAMELGLFAYTQRIITTNSHGEVFSFTPRLTGKGQVYFIDKLVNDFGSKVA